MSLFQTNLKELQGEVEGAERPLSDSSRLASIPAYQKYIAWVLWGNHPLVEVRQLYRILPDGRIGEWLGHGFANQSVMLQEEHFTSIDTPLLAIFSYPSAPNAGITNDPVKLAAYRAAKQVAKKLKYRSIREQPRAKVVVFQMSPTTFFSQTRRRSFLLITDFVKKLP